MVIAVLIKQTPDTEARFTLSQDAKSLDMGSSKFIINPYDEYAIEEAVKFKDKDPAIDIVIICFGPEDAKERILRALAMGAHRAVLVDAKGLESLDALGIAKVLAAALKEEKPSLILCGKQAIDDDNMQVGTMVAELMGIPHINVVTKISGDLKTNRLEVEREIEAGQTEVYDVELPALLGAHKSLNTPRFVAVPAIMQAKKKPIVIKTPTTLGLDPASLIKDTCLLKDHYSLPKPKQAGKIVQGETPALMVQKLITYLKEEAKII